MLAQEVGGSQGKYAVVSVGEGGELETYEDVYEGLTRLGEMAVGEGGLVWVEGCRFGHRRVAVRHMEGAGYLQETELGGCWREVNVEALLARREVEEEEEEGVL
jgi:hypothetical protein